MYDIYTFAQNDAWRFTLGKSGKRTLFTVGLNPSTATREKSDPTVARVEKVARNNGFDSFVMLNLYPVRSTDFRKLPSKVDARAFEANLRHIEETVAAHKGAAVWAAWGASVLHHGFFVDSCVDLIRRLEPYNVKWLRFGEPTREGHPRHPSRLDYSWSFSPLDARAYARRLAK